MFLAAAMLAVCHAGASPQTVTLNAVSAADPPTITDSQVDRAIERAVAFLWSAQRRDGRWVSGALGKEQPGASTALAAYTLRSAGVPVSDWRLRRAVAALKEHMRATRTVFARSWTLLLWCALDPVTYRHQIEEDIRFLNRRQDENGGWGDRANADPDKDPPATDHSTSQLALFALSEAASVRSHVAPRLWQREEQTWLASANADGGWGYRFPNPSNAAAPTHESYGTMTAAGLASLYLLYDQRYLDVARAFNGRFKARCGQESEKTREIRKAMERGWTWLDRSYRADADLPLSPLAESDAPASPLAKGDAPASLLAKGGSRGVDTSATERPDEVMPLREGSKAYYLHTISRASLASGRKRIGRHVWSRDVAERLVRSQQLDGSWGSVFETCLSVLALLNARTPVLINKLSPGVKVVGDASVAREDPPASPLGKGGSRGGAQSETEPPTKSTFGPDDLWNTDPRDAANLTRWLSRRWDTPVTWQLLELGSLSDDIVDAPILLMSGHEAPALDESQRAALREFVHTGGTILAVACCSKPEYVDGCRELFTTIFPRLEYGPIPQNHAVWRIREPVKAGEDCIGFHDACRTSIFIHTGGGCCAWQQNLFDEYERLFALAGNIAAYATFGRSPHGRLTPYLDTSTGVAEETVTIARLKHRGDWWAKPNALKHLSGVLSKRIRLGLDIKPAVTAGNARRSRASVLWLTGHKFEPFRPAGRVELKAYLAAGGTLVASACCGSEEFDAAFQAFASGLFGPEAWRPIDPQDPIMTGSFEPDLAGPLTGLAYRERYEAPPPARLDWPILYGIERDGRWVVIYSPHDINCGVSEHNCLDCVGYLPKDAQTIAGNILLYALRGPPKENEDEPADDDAASESGDAKSGPGDAKPRP